jgi:acetyl-CoA synthetase
MLIQEDLGKYRNRIKLRELAAAGEPLNPEIVSQVHSAWGLTVRDGYGQTETTALIGNSPGQLVKPGSMGRPLPGYEVELLNADGERSNEGEVCLKLDSRPVGLMAQYEDAAERTEDALRGGLYHTGDVATRDADGYIVFVGRTDDVFKSSDYRISPFELESVLMEHEAVAEVAVVASPDALRLAVPKAFITLTKGVSADRAIALEILSFARRRLAPYKRVRRLEFVVELPKTISGKLRRAELRAAEARREQPGSRADAEYFEEDFPHLK